MKIIEVANLLVSTERVADTHDTLELFEYFVQRLAAVLNHCERATDTNQVSNKPGFHESKSELNS